MGKMHIPVDDKTCWLCDDNKEESQLHLFFECKWTTKVQEELERWSGCRVPGNQVLSCLKWIRETLETLQKRIDSNNNGGKDLPHLEGKKL